MSTQNVQVRMQDKTISQVDKIQHLIGAPSRSDAIRRSIELSDAIASPVKEGDEVIIKCKNGEKFKVLIPGINEQTK